jgi:hypothetical protein
MTCFPDSDRIIVDDEVIGKILEHLQRSAARSPTRRYPRGEHRH